MSHPKIENAPGLAWRKRADGRVALWVARQDMVKRGFSPPSKRLWSGVEPTAQEAEYISAECQRLQNAMRAFNSRSVKSSAVVTVSDLLDVYQSDVDSPYHDYRPVTRADFDWRISVIKRTVGGAILSEINGRHFKQWYAGWRKPAEEDGPERLRRAHGLITMLRIALKFGKSLKLPHCRDLKEIISEVRFETAPPRTGRIDADMANAIRAAAHKAGVPSVALAQAIQFELTLRQGDVIGQWVKIHEDGVSAVTDRGQKWICGLRWDEIANGILTHKTSKRGQVLSFNLALYPMIAEELALIPLEQRVGPMIVSEATGIPWRKRQFAKDWRAIADAAGVPKDVWNMDSRAGGVTEAMDGDPSQEGNYIFDSPIIPG